MGLRKACKKAGIDEIWTPKKEKGTGTKTHPSPVMVLRKSAKQEKSEKETNPQRVLYKRMDKWVKEGFDPNDIVNAASDIKAYYAPF
jgi:hypothetical protein